MGLCVAPDEEDCSPARVKDFIDSVSRVPLLAPVSTIQRPRGLQRASVLCKLEALGVEAVPLLPGDRLEQGLLLLHAARRLQLVHGGQVEEHALVQVVLGVLLDHGLQLPEGVLEFTQVEQTHGGIVVGLEGGHRHRIAPGSRPSARGAGQGAAEAGPAGNLPTHWDGCPWTPDRPPEVSPQLSWGLTTAFVGSILRISVKNLWASAKLF